MAVLIGSAYLHAQSPKFLLPTGMAYDSAGNLFFADAARHQIFEWTLGGDLSVIAGTGEQGFGGDGDQAINAQLNAPQAVAVAADGTLYIADTGNQRIRVVSKGVISTIVGTGIKGSAGDGGPASAASLNHPTALALDGSGNLLICDTGNHRVRKISAGMISTIAGTGVQGFSGDEDAATAADLDSPSGVAVTPDGRVVIADSHNHRLRVVALDGVIHTLAGTGERGFSGDGGTATSAKLFLPRGVAVTSSGLVLFADSDNQRIRSINSQGVISTLAGNGLQGASSDGQAAADVSLDSPRSVVAPFYGAATLADSHNHLLREVGVDGNLYAVAEMKAAPVIVSATIPSTSVYGQGTVRVDVSGGITSPQGSVALAEAGTTIGVATLAGGNASLSLQHLAAGAHSLTASYTGDGLNPATVSSIAAITVQPAEVTATANPLAVAYGQAIPGVSGSANGILAQDSGSTSVQFSTTAGSLSPVGTYPITATLSGTASGNYKLSASAKSGSLQIVPAQSTLALRTAAATSYAGLPLSLNASLSSATAGVPTGDVTFLEGNTVVAKGTAANGTVSGAYLAPSAGTHVLTAIYGGDHNFLGSSSGALTVVVAPLPDFTVSVSTPSQTVQAGLIASYELTITPANGPFTGNVTFSVSGLPTNVQASFSLPSVVPGTGGAHVTLSLQTPPAVASTRSNSTYFDLFLAWLPAVFILAGRKKRSVFKLLATLFLGVASLSFAGCGARTAGTNIAASSRSFPLTVTATSTNVAGNVVAHSASLMLTMQ